MVWWSWIIIGEPQQTIPSLRFMKLSVPCHCRFRDRWKMEVLPFWSQRLPKGLGTGKSGKNPSFFVGLVLYLYSTSISGFWNSHWSRFGGFQASCVDSPLGGWHVTTIPFCGRIKHVLTMTHMTIYDHHTIVSWFVGFWDSNPKFCTDFYSWTCERAVRIPLGTSFTGQGPDDEQPGGFKPWGRASMWAFGAWSSGSSFEGGWSREIS